MPRFAREAINSLIGAAWLWGSVAVLILALQTFAWVGGYDRPVAASPDNSRAECVKAFHQQQPPRVDFNRFGRDGEKNAEILGEITGAYDAWENELMRCLNL